MRRKLLAGNWKMHGTSSDLAELDPMVAFARDTHFDWVVCPPSTLLARAAALQHPTHFSFGGQDCHAEASGAHTGDVSAEMLADTGASFVILGHSERRADHGETDACIQAKMVAARRAGLKPILCVGETLAQREAGETVAVISAQIAGALAASETGQDLVVAYEPVWAIGTGVTANNAQIAEVHAMLRAEMVTRFEDVTGNAVRLLYGGSVKPNNAAEIFAIDNVDGALVGGASLKAASFNAIGQALESA